MISLIIAAFKWQYHRHYNQRASDQLDFGNSGVPQRSPYSPLLFLLYTAVTMSSRNTIVRVVFTDGIGIFGFAREVSESAAAAQRKVDELTNWGH